MTMKLISKCERQFITDCITKRQKRIDGREFAQGRTLEIVFGEERGSCAVLLGNTRVMVQVSCDITEPRKTNPNEGTIHVNYELTAMASPEARTVSRSTEEFLEVQRSLERCIRDSKCVDQESLCILSGTSVFTIRVDVHAHNDDGNLAECTTIGAISALAHFRRQQVTVSGNDVTIHSINEKEPKPLNLLHMPITVNLALFDMGAHILVDPNEIEEKVCDGCYLMGVNAHQEFIFLHRRGILFLQEETIAKCEDVAMKRAQEITQIIRKALDDDAYKRSTNAPIGFLHLIQSGTVLGAKRQMAEISLNALHNLPPEENEIQTVEHMEDGNIDNEVENDAAGVSSTSGIRSKAAQRAYNILKESETEATVFEGGRSKWEEESDEEVPGEEADEVPETKPDISAVKEEAGADSEEETVYISKEQLDKKSPDKRGWFTKDPFA